MVKDKKLRVQSIPTRVSSNLEQKLQSVRLITDCAEEPEGQLRGGQRLRGKGGQGQRLRENEDKDDD